VLGLVDDKCKLGDDFDVEYLLELVVSVALFVFINDLDTVGLIKADEDF
jgi:hypothetical protein